MRIVIYSCSHKIVTKRGGKKRRQGFFFAQQRFLLKEQTNIQRKNPPTKQSQLQEEYWSVNEFLSVNNFRRKYFLVRKMLSMCLVAPCKTGQKTISSVWLLWK